MASRITRRTILAAARAFSRQDNVRVHRQFSSTPAANMKLLQFTYESNPQELRVGYLEGNQVVDANKADPTLPHSLVELLKSEGLEKLKKLASRQAAESVPLASVRLAAPLTGMDKVICVGLNYKDHCEEQNLTPPAVPIFFSKFASTVVGPNDAVRLRTDVTKCVDWEVELVVVIGAAASGVRPEDAYRHVLGYTVAQDISGRDWQKEKNGGQFLLGKAMDTFCPLGPWVVTADEIPDPQALDIECSVNGELKQRSNTCQLINKIPDVIARLSSVMTLLPGDIILTGTPGGVGMYRKPPQYLQPGDCIESKIQNIGTLTTRVEKF